MGIVAATGCGIPQNARTVQGDTTSRLTSEESRACTPAAVSRALAVNVDRLDKRELRELSPHVTEGSLITVLSDQGRARVVRFVDFGETGRTETTAY